MYEKVCVECQSKWKSCEDVQIKKLKKNVMTKKNAYTEIVKVLNLTTYVNN